MELKDKVKAILDASKKFSKRQIDIPGKGKGIMKLERGEKVSEDKVEVMYQRVLALENPTEIKTTKDNIKIEPKEEVDKYKDKIVKLEEENGKLKNQVGELQQNFASIQGKVQELEDKAKILEGQIQAGKASEKKEFRKGKLPEKVHGFSVICKKTTTDGRLYHKWYAHRRIEDKQHWVYLGNDAMKAEEKVRAWLMENYPDLLLED